METLNSISRTSNGYKIHRRMSRNDNCPFTIVDLIRKKRDKKALDAAEIEYFISGAVVGSITESQIGAMLMAICLNDMTDEETHYLTQAMINSGDRLNYPECWRGSIVGKHSTGGVGDKISLVLVPALAACGLKVPKISGRGLGYTGGTLDKLESIPGFRVTCTMDEIRYYVEQAGCCLVAQTNALVPADKVLYAIRDTTATVESIPLIAGSVMSKKAVESLDALVLELTFGKAMPLHTEADARRLAKTMIETSHAMGLKATAVLTKMHQPMGKMVGNSLEIIETIECLKGEGPKDIEDIVTLLGGYLLYHVNHAQSPEDGASMIMKTLTDGTALERFKAMLVAQGVSADVAKTLIENRKCAYSVLGTANYVTELTAPDSGYVSCIEAATMAEILRRLGACRERPVDLINLAVGLELMVQAGDYVDKGDVWVKVHHDFPLADGMVTEIQSALSLSNKPIEAASLNKIADIIN